LTHKSEFQESLKGIWLEKAEGLQWDHYFVS
jgi:hypothetical protein